MAAEIRFLPLGARRMAYEVRGDGPPLVAPAWWVSHLELDWQNPGVSRFWDGVAHGHTLIRYDRLGVGMSDRTVQDGDLTLDGEVATLRALLDELGLDRVSLIGGSSGSCTAVAFAAQHPERVDRLVLYGTYSHGDALTPPGVADAIVAAVHAHWGLGARLLSDIFLGGADADEQNASHGCSVNPRPQKSPPMCCGSCIASTSATTFHSCACRRQSCIAVTTAPCPTSSDVRSRPRFPVRHSFHYREVRTFRGMATSTLSPARAAKR